MANHKRKRPKNGRAGCLLCKPHKANHAKDKEKISVKRKLVNSLSEIDEYGDNLEEDEDEPVDEYEREYTWLFEDDNLFNEVFGDEVEESGPDLVSTRESEGEDASRGWSANHVKSGLKK